MHACQKAGIWGGSNLAVGGGYGERPIVCEPRDRGSGSREGAILHGKTSGWKLLESSTNLAR